MNRTKFNNEIITRKEGVAKPILAYSFFLLEKLRWMNTVKK